MVNTDTFIEMARLGLLGDKEKLRTYIEDLAAESSNKNKQRLNKELKKLLQDYSSEAMSVATSSSSVNGRSATPQTYANIWIAPQLNKRIEHFLAVHKDNSLPDHLKSAYSRLLLYGPPGSGKTTIGYYIAEQLSIPLVYVKVSDVISSKFGETTRNIAEIFARPGRQVIFLDEFDAFGKSRYDSNDVGELKRIVNSLIQTLDFAVNEKIVIGATNIIESIDPAIIRRFNLAVKVDRLDKPEMTNFFDYLLDSYAGENIKVKPAEKKRLINILAALGINTVDSIRSVFEHTVVNAHLSKISQVAVSDFHATLLTSGHLERDSIKKLSDKDKTAYSELMKSLTEKFNNIDISSYANMHRNSLTNYNKKSLNA